MDSEKSKDFVSSSRGDLRRVHLHRDGRDDIVLGDDDDALLGVQSVGFEAYETRKIKQTNLSPGRTKDLCGILKNPKLRDQGTLVVTNESHACAPRHHRNQHAYTHTKWEHPQVPLGASFSFQALENKSPET